MVELEASQDPYMLQVLTFLKGGKFEKISRWMWEDQNYRELFLFLRANGIAMDEIFNWVADQLDIPFNPPLAKGSPVVASGIDSIKSLWEELITKTIPTLPGSSSNMVSTRILKLLWCGCSKV